MQPPGRRPERGVAHHRSVAGMHVAAHGAVPLCLWVQREVPHHYSQPHLLLPVWQLHWQQPAGEDRAGVRFTPAVTISFFSFSTHRHLVRPTTASSVLYHWADACLLSLMSWLPRDNYTDCVRGLTLCGVIFGQIRQTTSTLCIGPDTARDRGSSSHLPPPTVLSRLSQTTTAHATWV